MRYKKLNNMLQQWDNGKLDFEPTCPRSTYNIKIKAMTDYIAIMEARAVMEGIELKEQSEKIERSDRKYENLYDYIS